MTEEKKEKEKGPSPRKLLFDYVSSSIQVWKTPDGRAFCDVMHDGVKRIWPFDEKLIDAWLRDRYVGMTHGNDIAPPGVVESVVKHLASQAVLTRSIFTPYTRVASLEDSLVYDLNDGTGRVVHVTAEGWTVETQPNIKFISCEGMLPQVEPQSGGTLDLLRKYLSLESEEDYQLVISWLIGAFVASDGYPILVLNGGKGTGKSSTTSILQRLVDPGKERREPPKDAKDIAAVVRNSHLLTIDNLQSIDTWLSDTLCRISTGGTLGARQYYTLHSDAGFEAIRPIILNGIPQFVAFDDLMERSVLLNLPEVTKDKRKEWKVMEREFEQDRPKIIGAIFDAISAGFRKDPEVLGRLDLPRLAGWGSFMERCKDHLGFSFLEVWETQEGLKSAELIANNRLAQAIISALEAKEKARKDPILVGTTAGIWSELATHFTGEEKDIPRGVNGFAAALKRLTSDLKRQGIQVFPGPRTAHGRKYEIRKMT